jgi:hypothetical protein
LGPRIQANQKLKAESQRAEVRSRKPEKKLEQKEMEIAELKWEDRE